MTAFQDHVIGARARSLPVLRMFSSSVGVFSSPEEYAAAIPAADVQMTVVGRGSFAACVKRVNLHRLRVQQLTESRPRVSHASFRSGRAIVTFLIGAGAEVVTHGVPLPSDGILCFGDADDLFQRTSGPTRRGSLSLPVADMTAVLAAVGGCERARWRDPRAVIPQRAALARLRRLHAAVAQLAEDASEVIENAEAARGLEQALIGAVAECLARGDGAEDWCAGRRHGAIMRRFYRALEAESDRALYLPELCAAIGVAERTLRVCCHEHLGMGPKQYLLLRRLHLAHRALGEAIPGKATVTDIATQFGFWQFGRFAGEYRALFGESPSATLRRQPA